MSVVVTVLAVLVAVAAPFLTTLGGGRDGMDLVWRLAAAVIIAAVVAYALDWLFPSPLWWTAVSIGMVAGVAGASVNAKQTVDGATRAEEPRSS